VSVVFPGKAEGDAVAVEIDHHARHRRHLQRG
jgi:hypothetical protein